MRVNRVPEHPCAACGKTTTRPAYCSITCSQDRRPRKACPYCLVDFRVTRNRVNYCSVQCMARMRSLGRSCPIVVKVCRCGERWLYHGKRRSHCLATYEVRSHAVVCANCGVTFIAKQGPTRFCSAACRPEPSREQRHAVKRRRKQRMRSVEPVYRKRIYERDGWRCQLCRRMVKRDAVAPHPLSPTLDHIVPLSVGGMHEPRNVQLAHFICNSRKSAGVVGLGEQLRLIA